MYRRSLFQRPLLRLDCSTRGGGPQGPRRPRFSFFRFTCQTARDRGVPLSGSPREPSKPKPPTEIGCWSPNISEELRRRAIAPRRRRTVFAYIGRRRGDCQHPDDGFLGNRSGGRSIPPIDPISARCARPSRGSRRARQRNRHGLTRQNAKPTTERNSCSALPAGDRFRSFKAVKRPLRRTTATFLGRGSLLGESGLPRP